MAVSREQELQEMIGSSAGEIYNYLNVNGETTFSKMKKSVFYIYTATASGIFAYSLYKRKNLSAFSSCGMRIS